MMVTRSAHGLKVSPRVEGQPGPLLPDCEDVGGHRRVVVEQVESAVGGIDRPRADAGPLPVDEPAESVTNPQHIARVEVAVDEPDIVGRRGAWNSSMARSHSAVFVVQRGGS